MFRHNAVLRQFVIGNRPEIPILGLPVPVYIETPGLNHPDQLLRQFQRLPVMKGPEAGGKRIYRKGLIVSMFCGILRLSPVIYGPVHAAPLPVKTFLLQKAVCPLCRLPQHCLQICLFRIGTSCGAIPPFPETRLRVFLCIPASRDFLPDLILENT